MFQAKHDDWLADDGDHTFSCRMIKDILTVQCAWQCAGDSTNLSNAWETIAKGKSDNWSS